MLKNKKYLAKDGYETLQYPSDCMRITQGCYGTFSHQTVPAIDDACGEISGTIYEVYAPCTMKCMAKDSPANGNAVWFESVNKVYTKNGKFQKVTMMMIHTNNSSWIRVGQIFKQGELCYYTGTAGKASGPHLHFEIAEGSYTGQYYHNIAPGATAWSLPNSIEPWKLCYVNDCKIVNGAGYDWKTYNSNQTIDSTKKFIARGNSWYLEENGVKLTGWQWAHWDGDNGAWYYFNPTNGVMVAGKDSKTDYPLIDNGILYLITRSGKLRTKDEVKFTINGKGECIQK